MGAFDKILFIIFFRTEISAVIFLYMKLYIAIKAMQCQELNKNNSCTYITKEY